MGYNARNDEIRDNIVRMQREWQAQRDALAVVEQFNMRLSAKKSAWFWPTISAALVSKHHWLVIVCDSCGTVIDLDLTVKRRDPDAPIRIAQDDVRCPRCNGHGRMRIVALSRHPSI
jgi:hypothetical protein